MSGLIRQNARQVLSCKRYDQNVIISHGSSADANVQLGIQVAYNRFYRARDNQSCGFDRASARTSNPSRPFPPTRPRRRWSRPGEGARHALEGVLAGACRARHLNALSCLLRRECEPAALDSLPLSPVYSDSVYSGCGPCVRNPAHIDSTDSGWPLLSTGVLNTSNRGGPALRPSGFRLVTAKIEPGVHRRGRRALRARHQSVPRRVAASMRLYYASKTCSGSSSGCTWWRTCIRSRSSATRVSYALRAPAAGQWTGCTDSSPCMSQASAFTALHAAGPRPSGLPHAQSCTWGSVLLGRVFPLEPTEAAAEIILADLPDTSGSESAHSANLHPTVSLVLAPRCHQIIPRHPPREHR
ncbi:hypothetical protein PsYK624_125830 [Phanerochaete sordida]|uniref:Uncharacterized protein n=1 Tax=Phanerochaete sordida TaxID=48140 RepID=A0A9P3LJN1_9APHY|nr:hypothetical protein PsYK624_125830 [Phanerochaete sordida]